MLERFEYKRATMEGLSEKQVIKYQKDFWSMSPIYLPEDHLQQVCTHTHGFPSVPTDLISPVSQCPPPINYYPLISLPINPLI